MRKIFGYAMLASPFIAISLGMVRMIGLGGALVVLGGAALVIGVLCAGIHLVSEQ